MTPVIVVGAGVAGLTCARLLARAGPLALEDAPAVLVKRLAAE